MKRFLLTILLSCLVPLAVAGQGFSIPRPPKTITDVPGRASWIVRHYWDNADLLTLGKEEDEVTEGSVSTLEQAFVNYLSLFDLTESNLVCSGAVLSLMLKADSVSMTRPVFSLARKYLFDLDSPMANEEHFSYFIEGLLSCGDADDLQKVQCDYWKSVIDNNRIGHKVEEFSFETLDGRLISFSEIEGQRLLLLFDIDCEGCRAAIEKLRQRKDCQIVAIALNASRKALNGFASSLPSEWICGWDSTGMINGGAFAVRRLPDIFLISSDGIVTDKHIRL